MKRLFRRTVRPVREFLDANPLLRFLALNWLAGASACAIVVAGILIFDIGHLRTLLVNSHEPVLPVLLLVFGFLVMLTSVAMAAAVMQLGRQGGGPGGRLKAPVATRIPVPVNAAPRTGSAPRR